jgi:hypothetical protein
MDGFTFYKSYYETLKKIRKKSDRALTALAVLEFMFEECEPENLTEGGEIAFESFRRTLETSRNNAGRGGRKPKTETQTNGNRIETETKPIENRLKTDCETSSRLRLSSITPPISPPNAGEGDAKTTFFEKYPALKGKRVKDDGIDYTVLLAEFEQSAILRGMYSFSKVAGMYESIKAGTYRDKVDEHIASVNAKAAREKWYAEKRDRAERSALGYQELARKDARFVEIERRLAKMNLALAKAELSGIADEYEALKAEQTELLNARLKVLDELGIYEWRLEPQYECKKCNDSGYLPSGKACGCYKGG